MSIIIDKGPYKIKKWGKEVDGEYIVDGYSYKGRKPLLKALKGFKDMTIKGFIGDINGVQIKVLDSRIIGAELAIDIECTENKSRGIAVLKLYGPSTKKQNVIMATKSKGSDVQHVITLAEKVIEPLLEKFLNDDKVKTTINIEKGENKCTFCDKTAKTANGLKGHITKMHRNNVSRTEEVTNNISYTNEIEDEATKIAHILLNEIVDNTEDSSDEDETVTKKYENKCDRCEFTVIKSRRYEVIRKLRKHKEEDCVNRSIRIGKKCDQCDYKAKDPMILKRHMRDKHDVNTVSTSPPAKKLRKHEDNDDEPMDTDENKVTETNNDKLEILLKERSDKMDAKIVEKSRINDEEEERLRILKSEEEVKKRDLESKIKEKNQLLNKKRKQNLKDQRKNANKKKDKETLGKEDIKDDDDNRIKEVPENCRHLVKDDDVIYVVPADGCCGFNSVAAFLFQDEGCGPELRRKTNSFMAKYWSHKYENLTQCSPGHPFEQKVGNKIIRFTDPAALKDFLETEEANFMWTDSEDLAVLSDMFQIKIKIITTKGKEDKNPTENWIFPDKDMKQFAELKNVDLDVMVLFHENDCHYNLVIKRNSDLALEGNIPTRLSSNIIDIDDKIDIKREKKEAEIVKLKKELKECKDSKALMEKKYLECVEELKIKTEEKEILKVEVNDLRMIVKLRDKLDEQQLKIVPENKRSLKEADKMNNCEKCEKKDISMEAVKEHQSTEHTTDIFSCNKCGFKTIRREVLSEHIFTIHSNKSQPYKTISKKEEKTVFTCDECAFKTTNRTTLTEHISGQHDMKEKEEEFNCKSCDFQTTTETQMKKHFTLKHTLQGLQNNAEIRCRVCGESFVGKRNFMIHRKQSHNSKVANCKNFIEGKCPFTKENCWWNHREESSERKDQIVCYICDKIFESKNDMMIHRKNKHESIVENCNKFAKNSCRLQNQYCWFLHKEEAMDIEVSENTKSKEDINDDDKVSKSVFQEVLENTEPPISKEKEKQKVE